MEDAFQALIRFNATDGYLASLGEYVVQAGQIARKNVVPTVLAVSVAAQGGQFANYEQEHRTKSVAKIIAEEQKGEDHSMPEPEQIPGMIVGLTVANTAASGDMIAVDRQILFTHVQTMSQDDEIIGFQMNYQNIRTYPTIKIV